MNRKFLIEVDFGQKGVEKTDIGVYLNGKLIGYYCDKFYDDLASIANELRAKYSDSEIETWCLGEDCAGRTHRWKITF